MPSSTLQGEDKATVRSGLRPRPSLRPLLHATALLWAFGRPHTLVGTSASVAALWVIAGEAPAGGLAVAADLARDGRIGYVLHGLLALVAALAANVYIVGLNQLTDVQIDRVNKPGLPIASGALGVGAARWIVAASGLVGLVVAGVAGPVLLATVGIAMAIGTAYSAPPLRLRRSPVLAALSIAAVRGIVVNGGISLHAAWVLGLPLVLHDRVLVLIAFVFAFSLGIAIAKDLPDTDGDRRYAVPTFALILGREAAFRLASAVLLASVFGMIAVGLIAAGLTGPPGLDGAFLAAVHAPIAIVLVLTIRRVDLSDTGSIRRFYHVVWAVFSAEYVVYPLACVLG